MTILRGGTVAEQSYDTTSTKTRIETAILDGIRQNFLKL